MAFYGEKTNQLLKQAADARDGKAFHTRQDSQRQKVYDAENRALARFAVMMTEREIVSLVRKIENSAYVIKNYGARSRNITTRPHGRQRSARGGSARIILPAWAHKNWVVIHEVAHGYSMSDPGHDWLFCAIYIDLVRKFISPEAGAALKAEFKRSKIRHAPPRPKRQMSAAQKAAAAARLAKAREARFGTETGEYLVAVNISGRDHAYYVRSVSKGHYGLVANPRYARVWKTRGAAENHSNRVSAIRGHYAHVAEKGEIGAFHY